MTISSMTGFARYASEFEETQFVFEARSVNGRGLEMRFRLPNGCENLEPQLRPIVIEGLKRGNIQLSLQFGAGSGRAGALRVNWAAVDELAHIFDRLGVRLGASPPSLDGVLQIRGILEAPEGPETDAHRQARDSALVDGFKALVQALASARRTEGARLQLVLEHQIDEIERLARSAAERVQTLALSQRARLKAQIEAALEMASGLSEDRLAQEVALLLVKADVGEELARIDAHIAATRDLMAGGEVRGGEVRGGEVRGGEAIGRRLEFLAQEFQREANTLCSKSADIELTRIGIDLKVVIDQFREQVQNIE
jgi:uncharacterized protein (TIGR00255 family)